MDIAHESGIRFEIIKKVADALLERNLLERVRLTGRNVWTAVGRIPSAVLFCV